MQHRLNQLKQICTSKWSIISGSFGIFPILVNASNVMMNFTSYFYIVIVWFIILTAMFLYHFYIKYSDNSNYKTDVPIVIRKNYKILAFISIFLFTMSITSLYYIHRNVIYYVVINKEINSEVQASKIVRIYNKNSKMKQLKLSTRAIKMPNSSKWEVILYNGFIVKSKAELNRNMVSIVLSRANADIVESRGTSLIKKIQLYSNHIFNFNM